MPTLPRSARQAPASPVPATAFAGSMQTRSRPTRGGRPPMASLPDTLSRSVRRARSRTERPLPSATPPLLPAPAATTRPTRTVRFFVERSFAVTFTVRSGPIAAGAVPETTGFTGEVAAAPVAGVAATAAPMVTRAVTLRVVHPTRMHRTMAGRGGRVNG